MPTPDVPTISGPVSKTNFIGGGRSDANIDGLAATDPLPNLGGGDGTLDSGSWTPTVAGDRITGTNGIDGHYTRIGDIVTCAVSLEDLEYNLDPGETTLEFTLTTPVASNFATAYSVAGTGQYFSNVTGFVDVYADSASDLIIVRIKGLADGSSDATTVQAYCQYEVV